VPRLLRPLKTGGRNITFSPGSWRYTSSMPLMPHIYAHKESNAFIQNVRDAMTTIVELAPLRLARRRRKIRTTGWLFTACEWYFYGIQGALGHARQWRIFITAIGIPIAPHHSVASFAIERYKIFHV